MKTESQIRNELLSKASADGDFRSLLLANPAQAVKECYGVDVSSHFALNVHEETDTELHLVLPNASPISEEDLVAISGGTQQTYVPDGVGF